MIIDSIPIFPKLFSIPIGGTSRQQRGQLQGVDFLRRPKEVKPVILHFATFIGSVLTNRLTGWIDQVVKDDRHP